MSYKMYKKTFETTKRHLALVGTLSMIVRLQTSCPALVRTSPQVVLYCTVLYCTVLYCRLTPRARSPHQSFPAPGVVLAGAGQHSAGSSSVTLARVNTDTSGRYTCEVSN